MWCLCGLGSITYIIVTQLAVGLNECHHSDNIEIGWSWNKAYDTICWEKKSHHSDKLFMWTSCLLGCTHRVIQRSPTLKCLFVCQSKTTMKIPNFNLFSSKTFIKTTLYGVIVVCSMGSYNGSCKRIDENQTNHVVFHILHYFILINPIN